MHQFYNYPNPIRNGSTTFRFSVDSDLIIPSIHIYDIEGDLIEVFNPDVNFIFMSNEFNEIFAELTNYNSGIYFAELRDNNKSLSFIKIAVIK